MNAGSTLNCAVTSERPRAAMVFSEKYKAKSLDKRRDLVCVGTYDLLNCWSNS
jgi:hypothetical protein